MTRDILFGLALCALPLFAGTPLPKAEKIPVTASSHPFGAANHTRIPEDLSVIGYVEEEFLISGTANVYDWPAPGPAVVRTPDVPYTTRLLIRRPANKSKFSGTVAVEMQNPSNLFDLNLGWTISHKEFARNGDVWAGITAKPTSVVALKKFDPSRYARLNWANPLPLDDPRNCARVANDSDRATENGLVWDMNSQVGAWLLSRDPTNPLLYGVAASAPHPVQHLIGWGYSQTGGFLYTYINAIHPLDVKANGKPIFDGYLVATATPTVPVNQCAAQIPQNDSRRELRDVGVPVMRVMTTSEYLSFGGGVAARLPDSDTPPNLTRNYEIAGAAHATPDELNFAASPADIEKAGRPVPPMDCNEGPRSRFPNGPAFNAIFHNLNLWIRKGTPPPKAEPIDVQDGKAKLDKVGNVIGGVRSPYVDVPTSTWYGSSTGESFCRIAGHEVPFDDAKIKELYPTHKAYVDAVKADADKLVKGRFMIRQDGEEMVEAAEKSGRP
jgi:hypothetical protein